MNDYTLFCLLAECGKKAMNGEIEAFRRNDTLEITSLPKDHKSIEVNWV